MENPAKRKTISVPRPLFTSDWIEFKVNYRYRNTFYHIQVKKTGQEIGKTRKVWVDGAEQLARFVKGPPQAKSVPQEVWINKPADLSSAG